MHAGSPSEESSSEATQMDDNRSVNGGDWRSEEGHAGLESVSCTSVGHHGLVSENSALQPQMAVPDHPDQVFLPHGTLPPSVFSAPIGLCPPPTVTYQAPTVSYQVPTVSYQAPTMSYQAPTGPCQTATDPHHHPGSSAAEFSPLMQGFLRFLQYMNWMMEDPAIQQLLHYSTSSSTMPDIGKQPSPQDQKVQFSVPLFRLG